MKHVVRTSAKAVIILEGRLLAVKNSSSGTDWYILPGGGQRHGETLVEALKRECMEEISLAVEPDDILFIRDYISANHEFALEDAGAHQVEFMFRCRIPEGKKPETGKTPDPHQTGIEWLPLEKLHEYALYPKQLCNILNRGIPEKHPVYLGDVN